MNGKTARLLRRNGVDKKAWNALSHKRKERFRATIRIVGIGEQMRNRIKEVESDQFAQNL